MTGKNTSGKLYLAMVGVNAAALMHASAGFAQDSVNSVPASASAAPAKADAGAISQATDKMLEISV